MRVLLSTYDSRGGVEPLAGTGNRALWDLNAQSYNALFREPLNTHRTSAGLTPIDDASDCFVVGEVNQQALSGRVAAVVHHGGAGTTTTATRAGAPPVVVPQRADQPYWAGRVADLGIGVAHDVEAPTIESLSAALAAVLTARTRARATAVAGRIRTDGAAVAATLLVDVISRGRPPAPRDAVGSRRLPATSDRS